MSVTLRGIKMEYEVGQLMIFNCYGQYTEGTFVRIDEKDCIVIKTTKDFVMAVGEEQSINKDFLMRI